MDEGEKVPEEEIYYSRIGRVGYASMRCLWSMAASDRVKNVSLKAVCTCNYGLSVLGVREGGRLKRHHERGC